MDKNFCLIVKTSLSVILLFTKIRRGFQQQVLLFFDSLHQHPALRVVSQAGGEGNAVVCGGLEIAPIGIGDDLHGSDLIGTGAVDRSIGDDIALLQILDGADDILAAPVVAAHRNISVPGRGGTVMPQALFHALGGLTLPHLHIDLQGGDLDSSDAAVLVGHTLHTGVGRLLVCGGGGQVGGDG